VNGILLVALGGALGSALRHGVNIGFSRLLGVGFLFGTLFVNVTGSLAMGLLIELVARRFGASVELRLFLTTGFLGGYTTFSAFSLDAIALYERGAVVAAASYVLISVILSLAAVFAGLALARHMT